MNNLKWRTLGLAALASLTMGITMPSCPGQQAMQQQIDSLTTENQSLKRQLKDLDTKLQGLNAMSTEFGQAKQLLQTMTDTIKEQQNAIAQMDTTVKALAAKVEASSKAAAPRGYPVHTGKPLPPKRPTLKRNY